VSVSTDEQRFRELYRELGPAVYRRCLRLLGDRELAQDATQEVFLKLSRRLSQLGSAAHALPWAYRVALHHCLNVRREAFRRTHREAALPVSPEAVSIGFEEAHLGQQLLGRFDALTQAVAVGVLVDGEDQEQLAQALAVSRKTVSRKLKRFLTNARKFLVRSDP
jgi:RNA polymerase sigma-70 factor (ECF subfamily)